MEIHESTRNIFDILNTNGYTNFFYVKTMEKLSVPVLSSPCRWHNDVWTSVRRRSGDSTLVSLKSSYPCEIVMDKINRWLLKKLYICHESNNMNVKMVFIYVKTWFIFLSLHDIHIKNLYKCKYNKMVLWKGGR